VDPTISVASQASVSYKKMSSKTSPTVLPRYTDLETESAPLLACAGVDVDADVKDNSKAISGQYEELEGLAAPAPRSRCSRFGWCKRWCKNREPECENRRCVRRKKFARVFLILIGAFFIFHLAKFAYTIYTLPKHVQCIGIDGSATIFTVEMPLSRKLLFHNSLSTGDISVIRDEGIPEGSFEVRVDFDSVKDRPESAFCSGRFKRALFLGAFTKDEGESLPPIKQTTLVLPVSAPTPFIGFGLGGRKGRHHCVEKMVRKLLNFKKKPEADD